MKVYVMYKYDIGSQYIGPENIKAFINKESARKAFVEFATKHNFILSVFDVPYNCIEFAYNGDGEFAYLVELTVE